jgi:hypothetical protein
MSTIDNTSKIVNSIFGEKGRKKKFYLLVDQEKAFDRVLPKRMNNLWWKRATELNEDQDMLDCIIKYQQVFGEFKLKFNDKDIKVGRGVPQGSCISPALFNFYQD